MKHNADLADNVNESSQTVKSLIYQIKLNVTVPCVVLSIQN